MEDFRRIYETYYPAVRSYFARRGLPPEDCFDLTQETFLGIHRGMERYQDEQRLGPWVFTITKNVYRKRLRSRGAVKRAASEVSIDDPGEAVDRALATRGDQEERLLEQEQVDLLHQAIDQLSEAQRQCLTLYLEGLSYKEIAALLKLAPDTVKSHLRRAHEKLKSIVRDFDLEQLDR